MALVHLGCEMALLVLPSSASHLPTPTFGPQLQTKDKPQPAHPHCLNFLAKLLKEKRILAKPFSPH